MWKPDQLTLPENCNLACWINCSKEVEELVGVFASAGWQANVVDRDYSLTRLHQWRSRTGRVRFHREDLSLSELIPKSLYLICGRDESPDWMGREIRKLFWRSFQCNTIVCLWGDREDGVWRDDPMTTEMLPLSPASLSDADLSAVAAGYVRRRVSGSDNGKRSQGLGEGLCFLSEYVVVDEIGVTHYDEFRGISRLEWNHVREVAAEWIIQAFTPIPYATLTGDSVELIIREGCRGFSSLLDRLAALAGFPSEKFEAALNSVRYDEKEVVWRQYGPLSSSEDQSTG